MSVLFFAERNRVIGGCSAGAGFYPSCLEHGTAISRSSVGADDSVHPPCHSEPVTDVTGVGIHRGVKKTCRRYVFSLRSRRLCRRSIRLGFRRTVRESITLCRDKRNGLPCRAYALLAMTETGGVLPLPLGTRYCHQQKFCTRLAFPDKIKKC